MIYLVGVDHLVQYNGPVPEQLRIAFRDFIMDASLKFKIDILAEEFSLEALFQVYSATEATLAKAAGLLGIEHRFCDPEEADLRSMGVPSYAEAREEVKKRLGVKDTFILDGSLRQRVAQETTDLVRSYWHIRENFWYERIKDAVPLNILFVCGHEHVMRFHTLLEEKEHRSKIITRYWKEEIFRDYTKIGLH